MFPLKVVLIGHDEGSLPPLRRAIREHTLEDAAEFPNVEHVLQRTRPGEKALFVVLVQGNYDLADVRRLCHAFPGQGVLAVVDKSSDAESFESAVNLLEEAPEPGSLYHRAMRAGATQLASTPIDPHDIGRALDCLALHFGGVRSRAKIIAVSGATGGAGATVMATNLAYEISELSERRCVLAEPQARMGMVGSYLNLHPQYTLQDLLDVDELNIEMVKQVLVDVSPRLAVLCGPDGMACTRPTRTGCWKYSTHCAKLLRISCWTCHAPWTRSTSNCSARSTAWSWWPSKRSPPFATCE